MGEEEEEEGEEVTIQKSWMMGKIGSDPIELHRGHLDLGDVCK